MFSKIIVPIATFIYSLDVFSAEKSGGMPQLNPETFSSQLFWLVVFFVIVFTLNHFLFLPKLNGIRMKRKKTIDKYISDANNINSEIAETLEKMEKDLKKAKDEYNAHIKSIYDDNKKIYEKKMNELNEKIEQQKEKYVESLMHSEKKIRKDFPKICVNLSDKLYQNIMSEKDLSSSKEFNNFEEGK